MVFRAMQEMMGASAESLKEAGKVLEEGWKESSGETLNQPNVEAYKELGKLMEKDGGDYYFREQSGVSYRLEKQKNGKNISLTIDSKEVDVGADFLNVGEFVDLLVVNIAEDPRKSNIWGTNRFIKQGNLVSPSENREQFEDGMIHLNQIIIPKLKSIDNPHSGV